MYGECTGARLESSEGFFSPTSNALTIPFFVIEQSILHEALASAMDGGILHVRRPALSIDFLPRVPGCMFCPKKNAGGGGGDFRRLRCVWRYCCYSMYNNNNKLRNMMRIFLCGFCSMIREGRGRDKGWIVLSSEIYLGVAFCGASSAKAQIIPEHPCAAQLAWSENSCNNKSMYGVHPTFSFSGARHDHHHHHDISTRDGGPQRVSNGARKKIWKSGRSFGPATAVE